MSVVEIHETFLERGRRASPQVFERLREMIISLDLPPGTVLVRADLMSRFRVSQTPIRDALLKLAEEDLVDIFPQHATIVSRIDPPLALQAHFLRRSLELEVVEKLALAEKRDFIEALNLTLMRQRASLEAGNLSDFDTDDSRFHQHLYEAAAVPSLWPLIRSRSGHIDRLRRLHLPEMGKALAILSDHHEILDAIARRKPQLAREALHHHLSGTLSQVEAIKQRFPEYMR